MAKEDLNWEKYLYYITEKWLLSIKKRTPSQYIRNTAQRTWIEEIKFTKEIKLNTNPH